MKNNINIITIDGPGGSGKGTMSLMLAQKLGWNFLDSGVLYRSVAFYLDQNNIDIHDINAVMLVLEKLYTNNLLQFEYQKNLLLTTKVYLSMQDVTALLRTESVAKIASRVSQHKHLRLYLNKWFAKFCKLPGLIADGRDMGTEVFPQAVLKFYLTASVEERARRRYLQLKKASLNVNLADLEEKIRQRDKNDQRREISPLRPAEDAICIDSTNLSSSAVFALIEKYVKQNLEKQLT